MYNAYILILYAFHLSVFLKGYWFPDSIITSQGPMANTVGDFLHMLYQMQVKAVFMLSDCTENEKAGLIFFTQNK